MTGRVLQFILGVVIFFCSTPAGMAQEAIREEARADFFAPADVSDSDRQSLLSLEELALLPGAEITIDSEDSTGGEQQGKRGGKHHSQHARRLPRYVFTKALFVEKETERAVSHPQQRDVRQERTELIRLLHLASLAC